MLFYTQAHRKGNLPAAELIEEWRNKLFTIGLAGPSGVGLESEGAGFRRCFANSPSASLGGKIEVFIMRIGRYESSENNIGTAITFLLIGLGAGAMAGLLLAPKTGKQMRRDLQRGFEDAKDTLGDWADDAKDRVREAGDRVRDVASKGVDLADDLREKVEPLRRVINRG